MSRITLTQIQTALMIPVTGVFISDKLGIKPTEAVKRAVYWQDSDYQQICQRLIAHIGAARDIDINSINGERPKKAEAPAAPVAPSADAAGSADDFFSDAPAADSDVNDFFGTGVEATSAEAEATADDFFG